MSLSVGEPQPNVNANVLMEILGANESVAGRIAAYQKAKADAEEALANLRIGQDAKAAYEDANAKHAEAQAALDRASEAADAALKMLADATTKARTMVEVARLDADRIVAEANGKRAAHEEAIAASAVENDAKRAEADRLLCEAREAMASLVEKSVAADRAKLEHDEARAKADDATARAEAAEAKATELGVKLQAALDTALGK